MYSMKFFSKLCLLKCNKKSLCFFFKGNTTDYKKISLENVFEQEKVLLYNIFNLNENVEMIRLHNFLKCL